MECILCKIQCIGKAKTPINIRLKNHKSDVFVKNAISTHQHFSKIDHNFNKQSNFPLIETMEKTDQYNLKDISIFKKQLYDPFLWLGFNCLKVTKPLRGDSLPFSSQKFLVLS